MPPSQPGLDEPVIELDALAKQVVDAALEVHREIGPGFGELTYEHALAIELGLRQIPFTRQSAIRIHYKGRDVGEGRMDLLVGGQLVVELKAVESLAPVHTAQLLAYLKASGLTLGLLVNFNVRRLAMGVRRVILARPTP